jgi:hypothetical protein
MSRLKMRVALSGGNVYILNLLKTDGAKRLLLLSSRRRGAILSVIRTDARPEIKNKVPSLPPRIASGINSARNSPTSELFLGPAPGIRQ